ncbi:HAT, C-terminal dimerization domain containing protein [Trema orientale]|uniref:HAT, C-terminal dimerization domain containing protein n=1 Tax=Trema orientale TaxID=63057 RepID=A0A2P5FTF9_TREOI|nr:HAT, C-terminal dimerization domain containing protein [Trema orientale]
MIIGCDGSIASFRDSFLLAKLNMNDEEDTNDLEDYLADRREKLKDNSFEILEWWNRNAVKYKIVSHMAKDVLAVQMSTVASESAFSTSGRILDPFRSSLSPKMVEALICTKNWLSAGSDEPIVLRQYIDEIEALEISEQVAPADGSCITSIDKEIE